MYHLGFVKQIYETAPVMSPFRTLLTKYTLYTVLNLADYYIIYYLIKVGSF